MIIYFTVSQPFYISFIYLDVGRSDKKWNFKVEGKDEPNRLIDQVVMPAAET
jgi:hypothetical protein